MSIPIHRSNQSFLELGVKINYSYENLIRNLVTRVCGCRAHVLRINLSADYTAVLKGSLLTYNQSKEPLQNMADVPSN